ncbi:MAG: uroporphyrinogen-III decarboxylase [Firmicutes bacterium]|nr:uroporphyrinogen-III decarboxylase [Bacillota bacterium]
MTQRENILKVYNHQKPEFTPIYMEAVHIAGIWSNNETGVRGEEVRPGVKTDVFGTEWSMTHGAPVPMPGNYVLDDICNWRNLVFPDPYSWDWDYLASVELKDYDKTKALVYFCEQGCFDRLTQLLGFEKALMALVEEPDECYVFFQAMADYKIKVIECVAKHYHPDVFTYTDDIAQATSLFMRPDIYRELIKPAHARIIKAIRDHGMIAEQHTCGKWEAVAEDYVEIGVQSEFPGQSSNDLISIIKKYGDKIVINGGFDSQGPAGYRDATAEVMAEEAKRMAREYAVLGNYIALPMIGQLGVPPTEHEMMLMGTFFMEFRKACNALGV